MIYFSIALFSLAASLGVAILVCWLRQKDLGIGTIYSHGGVEISALVLLSAFSITHPQHYPLISLVLFSIGVIAGLYMFFHIGEERKTKNPISIAFIHAFFVVSGFVSLLIFTFN
jgi:CHASE2 domain-containing sensor protein